MGTGSSRRSYPPARGPRRCAAGAYWPRRRLEREAKHGGGGKAGRMGDGGNEGGGKGRMRERINCYYLLGAIPGLMTRNQISCGWSGIRYHMRRNYNPPNHQSNSSFLLINIQDSENKRKRKKETDRERG